MRGQREITTAEMTTRRRDMRGRGPHPWRTPPTMTDPIREGQGVGIILTLILVLGRDKVQQPSVRIMDGIESFVQRLMRELKMGVWE